MITNLWVDNSTSGVLLDLGDEMSGSLGFGSGLIRLLDLLLVKVDIIVLEVPLSEWIGINGDNAVLDEGLGTDKLVVGGVVNDIKNSSLSGLRFRTP